MWTLDQNDRKYLSCYPENSFVFFMIFFIFNGGLYTGVFS